MAVFPNSKSSEWSLIFFFPKTALLAVNYILLIQIKKIGAYLFDKIKLKTYLRTPDCTEHALFNDKLNSI